MSTRQIAGKIDPRTQIVFATIALFVISFVLLHRALAPPSPAQVEAQNRQALASGEVVKVAEAPDGTVLWAKKIGNDTVYFPSATVSR